MDWSSIKYIFQIPVSWYEKIHDRVFNAYGVNFIRVKEGDWYGGMEIGVDEDAFQQAVNRSLEGIVRSVNGNTPDANGNVELDNVLLTDVSYQQYVQGPVSFNSGIDLSTYGGMYGGIDGNVNFTRFMTTNNDGQGANGILLYGANAQLLEREPDRLYNTGADNQIASRGYCRLNFARTNHTHGNISNDGKITNAGTATTLDYYIAADADGNLYRRSTDDIIPDMDDYVTDAALTQTLQSYVTNTALAQTLQDYVTNTTLQNYATISWVEAQNYLTSSDLSNYVTNTSLQTTLQNYVTQQDFTTLGNTVDDLGDDVTELSTDVELLKLDWIKSVDGHSPDNNGAVSFNLLANKWLKSDGSGHIVTTNDTPITVSPSSSGYIYNNNGTVEYKDDEYVTLDTQQTITASKYFNNSSISVIGGQIVVKDNSATGVGTTIDHANIFLNGGSSTTYINMSYGNAANDAYITKSPSGISIIDPVGVVLNAPVNQATLTNHPTDTSTSSKAIATVGYCQDKFLTTPPSGYTPTTSNITVVTGISWNGTQIVATRTQLRFYNGVFVGTVNQTNETINTVAYTP